VIAEENDRAVHRLLDRDVVDLLGVGREADA
jgi:hypothetical protein